MSESYELDVDRITAGAIGPPGQRVFYLQARAGQQVLSLKVEKQQVAALSAYLTTLLADLPEVEELADDMELEQPVDEAWVVGSLGVTYDEASDRVLLVAEELVAEEEEGAEARIHASRQQIAALARHGDLLVAAGRPPCPLCGNPLDPRGHVCPRLNGHGAPTP